MLLPLPESSPTFPNGIGLFRKKSSVLSRHGMYKSGLARPFLPNSSGPIEIPPRLDSSGSGERKPDRASQHVVEVVCHLRREGPGREVRARRHQARREESGTLHVPRAGKDGGSGVFGGEEFHDALLTASASALAPPTSPISPRPRPPHTHTHTHSLSRARSRVSVVLTRASHPNFRLLSARRQGFR